MSDEHSGRDLALGAASTLGRGAGVKVALVGALLALLGVMFLGLFGGGAGGTSASGIGVADPCVVTLPQADLSGAVGTEQEQIARVADEVATEMNMPGQAVLVILMTGLQESGIRNLDYGDRDSVGWLQQRPSQGWGTVEQIMDPAYGARKFYEALRAVPGWTAMPYWQAAQSVQRSAYPEAYARHEDRARQIAATIGADLDRTGDAGNVQGPPAPVDAAGVTGCGQLMVNLTADGWTHPAPGMTRLTSRFGEPRAGYTHMGDDLAAPAGTPILAAADGVATHVSCLPWKGRSQCNILLDHGTDELGHHIETLYVHMFPDGVLVQQGDTVTAGQQIGAVGNNGNSLGFHLHLEVWIDGVAVSAVQFFADHGVNLSGPPAA